MELTVYWTQFAEDKLEDVFLYYIEKASEKIALHLVNGIIDKSLEIGVNPIV
jgi:plasmid stabilization system protein ParE